MLAILIPMYSLATLGSTVFAKITSSVMSGASRAKYSLFLVINGFAACLLFWVMGGFSINANLTTLIFSAMYAFIVAASLILNRLAYAMASVLGVNIIMYGCSLLCTSAMGIILFSEEISLLTVCRILIMMASISATFVDANRSDRVKSPQESVPNNARNTVKLCIVMVLIVIVSCADIVILKYFTLNPNATDETSFFFFTNVLLCLGSSCVLSFEAIIRRNEIGDVITIFKPRTIVGIVGNVLSSNVVSFLSVAIIALMNVSVYTPVVSAIGVLMGVVASLIFREKLGVFSYVSAILALIAVII